MVTFHGDTVRCIGPCVKELVSVLGRFLPHHGILMTVQWWDHSEGVDWLVRVRKHSRTQAHARTHTHMHTHRHAHTHSNTYRIGRTGSRFGLASSRQWTEATSTAPTAVSTCNKTRFHYTDIPSLVYTLTSSTSLALVFTIYI